MQESIAAPIRQMFAVRWSFRDRYSPSLGSYPLPMLVVLLILDRSGSCSCDAAGRLESLKSIFIKQRDSKVSDKPIRAKSTCYAMQLHENSRTNSFMEKRFRNKVI